MTNPLEDLIWAQIIQDGPMDIGRFMALALGHPEHGYYNSRDPFGRAGDFTTAPEISQVFGELIGAWVADIWAQMGRPDPFIWLECGPGRGSLMADALRATRRVPGFHAAARIVLMEMSPVLKERQRAALDGYNVQWVADLDDPLLRLSAQPLICVANEFLDALPIRQFVRHDSTWHERVVGVYDGALAFGLSPPVVAPCDATADGIYEVAPARNDFIRALCARLRVAGGAALLIDYGYARSGAGDTLQAVKAHQFAPVLADPGTADITAHVDFDAAARVAVAAGVRACGPAGQGDFLRALGIGVRAEMLKRQGATDIDEAVHRLTDDAAMGSLFKVMALCAGDDLQPAGVTS